MPQDIAAFNRLIARLQSGENIPEINLDNQGLTVDDVKILVRALNPSVKELSLQKNQLLPGAAIYVKQLLENNKVLQVLNLGENALGDRGLAAIA